MICTKYFTMRVCVCSDVDFIVTSTFKKWRECIHQHFKQANFGPRAPTAGGSTPSATS
jgi:hypothetical protein